jgi:hypothetical protein
MGIPRFFWEISWKSKDFWKFQVTKIGTFALTWMEDKQLPWKDHFKSDLRSVQDLRLKKDLRSNFLEK